MSIMGNQITAGRALIDMHQQDLAERAGVGITTIRRMEAYDAEPVKAMTEKLDAVVAALNAAGVVFLDEDGEGYGVRLRRRQRA